LEAEARKSYEEQLKAYEGEKLVFEQRKSALKDDVKRAIKNGQDTGHLIAEMDQEPEPPARIRYIVNDATVEKLGEMLCQNPNGIMMFRDELSGWLAQLGRDGHENDRGFYLEAWNGSGSYQYDRIGRGTLFIESACLSLFGTIQPGPLLARLRGGGDAESDGMIQRFQLLVWPDPPAQWRQVDQWSDASARATIKRVFRRIRDTSLPCADDDAIPYLHFDESAQDIFDTWRGVLEQRLRSGAMSNLLQSHVAKYRSLMPALALIGHLADWASDDESGDCPGPVTARAARMSTALCQVLESHAARVYGAATDGKERMAGEILDLIRSGDIRAQFVARDIYHHRSSNTSLGDPVAVTAALSCLVDLGWARVDAVKRGGRPASVYTAHPCVTHP
jgi:putative DNA primase/helicase